MSKPDSGALIGSATDSVESRPAPTTGARPDRRDPHRDGSTPMTLKESVLQEWNARLLDRVATGTPRDVILRSWTRSHAAGLDAGSGRLRVRQIPPREFSRLLQENARLIDTARPHLEALSRATPVPHVAYLVCREGVVVLSTGTDEEQTSSLGLAPGHDWSESAMGTNGAGTALAERCPVTIFGQDHYLEPLKGFICTAAPIRDPSGQVVGALDLSTSVADGRPEYLLRVIEAATRVEGDLR